MNKHLINAARYLDAVHGIEVDESNPNLETIINNHRAKLKSEALDKYWVEYLKDINFYPEDDVEEEEEVEEKVIYYRGVAQKTSRKKEGKPKKGAVYRGSKVD